MDDYLSPLISINPHCPLNTLDRLVVYVRYRSSWAVPISAVFTWVILGGGQIKGKGTYYILNNGPVDTQIAARLWYRPS